MADGREERETIDGRCVNRFSRPGFSRPGWVHFWGSLRCGSVSPSPPVGLLVCLWGQSPKLARFTFKLFYNSPSIAPLHFWIWKAKGQGFKDAKNGKMAESLLVVTAPQMLRHTSSKDQNVPIPGRVCPSIHSSIHPSIYPSMSYFYFWCIGYYCSYAALRYNALTNKGSFIATQLNSTQLDTPTSRWLAVRCNWVSCIADRRRQLSCVGEGVYSDATELNWTQLDVELSWVELRRYRH